MYCIFEAQFFCSGTPQQTTPVFNAMLDDLAAFLSLRHPGVLCTRCLEGSEPLTAEGVRAVPDTEHEATLLEAIESIPKN